MTKITSSEMLANQKRNFFPKSQNGKMIKNCRNLSKTPHHEFLPTPLPKIQQTETC